MIDQDHGIVERPENEPFPLLSWSNDNNEEDQEIQFPKSGEEFSDEIVGSLVEAAALLGLEDNNINPHHNIIYGPFLETQNPILISTSGVEASNENANANTNENANANANANAKKEEHNAKERERRMKLSQTYFSLRSLLPNSRRSKVCTFNFFLLDLIFLYIFWS